MALKNIRLGTDQRFALSLSNAGVKVNMNDVEVLHLCMYSNDQKSNDGSIGYAVNADDTTVLDLLWPAKSQSYLGSHSVHGTIRYAGAVASFDIPAVNVVSKTSEADISTDTIVLDAPVGTEDLSATITIQGLGPQGPQGPKGDKMTYADLTESDKADLYEGGASLIRPLIDGKANKATTLAGYGIGDAYTKSEVDVALDGKQDTLTAGNGISIERGVISSTVDSLITPITYAELVALRNSASLVAGMQYRITDYACTTTQENTQSAGHPFDIIVTADSENTLNEEARAIQHEGDTYFADCDLNAWKIWYCLDNDATRFAWADSANGKGIIYRMIDEWNNDVPYDFKNIMYNGSWGYWAFTFNWINDESDNTCEDLSVAQYVHTNDERGYSHTYGNIIKPYGGDGGGNYGSPLQLNVNVFLNSESYDGGLFYGCSSNTFGNDCYYNIFGSNCSYNTFGNYCSANTLGYSCNSNTFWDSCDSNIFGNGCSSNIFGIDCDYNTFGNYCSSNIFGIGCFENTFGSNCSYNTFGNGCNNNTFGNDGYSNIFGSNCSYIKFSSSSSATTKYNYYRQNHFGDGCQYILFKRAETASSSALVQNYNFAQGVQGTSSAYLTIDGVRNRAYETKVAKNSSGELKIYCEADLIQ